MKSWKTMSKIGLMLIAVLLIPAVSFAIIDASVYGGYSFNGKLETATSTTDADVKGKQYGVRAHINTGIPMVFTVGGGLFYQLAPLKYDVESTSDDLTKKTYGFDAYAQLDLPFLPVYPYVRGGIAIQDKLEIGYQVNVGAGGVEKETKTYDEYFKSSYYGVGLAYSIYDLVVLDLQIFCEYLFTTSKQEDDVKLKGHAVNLGLQVVL